MKRKGFTLIELIISMSIITILFSMVNWNFSKAEEFQAYRDIKKLKYNIEFIRDVAITKNSITRIKLYPSYYILYYNGKKEKIPLSKDIRVRESNMIVFNGGGQIGYYYKGTMMFKIKNKIYKITVEPISGKVNLRK